MSANRMGSWLEQHSDLALAGLVIGMIGMMIVPLPTPLLDVLLTMNIGFAVTLLMVSLYIPSAVQLASLPSILLISTLFRLSLNVSSTRLILLHADAGAVIQAFGDFVVQGNYVVGTVIFLILTIIQFLVVAKGAERVSEVAARFTLDAMPGKQMSIDADLRAGAFDLTEARRRRSELQKESKLYGAMDGAMKFVKGDAIAGVIITVLNICAGIVIGVLQLEMSVADAAGTYTLLTIGDGLVSQIPSLIIAITAGIVVTRVADEDGAHLGGDIVAQITAYPKALTLSGGLLLALALIPGLPAPPFVLLGLGALFLAFELSRPEEEASEELTEVKTEAVSSARQARNLVPTVTPVTLELGVELSDQLGEPGLTWIRDMLQPMREGVFLDTGVKIPAIRIKSHSKTVEPQALRVHVHELPQTSEIVPLGKWFVSGELEGIRRVATDEPLECRHPINRRPAAWVSEPSVAPLEASDHRVWKAEGYILMALTQVLKTEAHRFVGLQEVQDLLSQLETAFPATVQEVIPKHVSLIEFTEVLRRLAAEHVSIRNLRAILEAVAVRGKGTKDPIELVERIREALSGYLTNEISASGVVVYIIDREIEDMVGGAIRTHETGKYLALPPSVTQEIVGAIQSRVGADIEAGRRPVLLTDQSVRRYIKRLVELGMEDVRVYSYQELDPSATIQPMGRVTVRAA